MAYQELAGKFYCPAYTFTVNATVKTCTPADYWCRGYTGETTDFLSHIQTLIKTVYASATVTYSLSTGLVTIAFGTTGSITWTMTALRDILGFTANITSQTSVTATNPLRYVWRPTRPINLFPHENAATNLLVPESNSLVRRSINGTVWMLESNTLHSTDLRWMYLTKAEVLTPASGNDASFQNFWTYVCSKGRPFRYFPDRSVNTSADFVELILRPGNGERVGDFSAFRSRSIESYNGYWDINLPCWKWISP